MSEGQAAIPAGDDGRFDAVLAQIQQALRSIRYGSITITIQDGVVVQLERAEKFRIKRRSTNSEDASRFIE